MPAEQGLKEKESTQLESGIHQLEVKNKNYSEIAYRLEIICNKLADESQENKKELAKESKPELPGHISRMNNALDHYTNLNNRMENYLSKLEIII